MVFSTPTLLGHYRPMDSYLHRIDTRSKLVPVLVIMVLGLLTESLMFYLGVLVTLLIGLMFSGIGLRAILQSFRPILILIGVTFLYHVLFTGRDSRPLIQLFGFAITEGGISGATFYSARLLLFVGIMFLVTLTSSPSSMAEAVAGLFRPFRRLGVPVDELGLMLLIAIRFIPVLHQEFLTIRNAQIIRGVSFSGHLFGRIRRTAAIVVPVLAAAIGRADELALAMEARGYRSGRPRTSFSRTGFDARSWIFALASCAFLAVGFIVTGG